MDNKNVPKLWLSPAQILSVDLENRIVNVNWVGAESGKQNIPVICLPGAYSMPKVEDIGLVIGDGIRYYYLGNIEYEYKKKLGIVKNEKGEKLDFVDPQTGTKILAKKVDEGETFLGNLAQRMWLSLSNSGNFALLNGNDGITYSRDPLQLLKVAGQTLQLVGNSVRAALGSCVRETPTNTAIPDETGTTTAPEVFFETTKVVGVAALRMARLHLGYVRDKLGHDELGSWGQKLGAILEVCQAGLTVAALKMDKIGNIEMTSTSGNMMLDSGPAGMIQIGGLTAAQSAVFGENLLTWLNGHTHGTGVGPSSTPITPATNTLLSPKVKVG